MFSRQAQQVAALVPARSARDILASLANSAVTIRHAGPIGVLAERDHAPKAFRRPPGRRLHSSVTRSRPVLRASPPPPPWKDLPGRPPDGRPGGLTLTVPGTCRLGETETETLETTDAKADTLTVRGVIVNDGLMDQGGPAVFGGPVVNRGPVEVHGDLYVEQVVNLLGPVTHHNVVNNWGPVFNNGPVFQQGPVVIKGQELVLVPVEVVTDVFYLDGSFQKTTRRIMAAAQPGPATTTVVFECA